ncbi:unnamed protein product [Rotaria sordida]|uniref:Uncharacterized protein n=1 Tax=Rotaria sordida TaxID=392033 RepID=A0A813U8T1_9BILA|nr:unnamed protein product [Rotaria sordida]CAF0819983.1 unnamed protein product [Rotaria sordida]CAF0826645.1 unnamed protein product [Rotaria sordida]CAF3719887.1 unnamed protein product [Rotaria sordida]CAF3775399.1 unnamed protein product [Rotaria sordida]
MWCIAPSIKRKSGEVYRNDNDDVDDNSEYNDNYLNFIDSLYKEDRRLHNLLYRKSKLESVNQTSALLSGFAIVAIVELSLDSYKENKNSEGLIISYAIISCLLVGSHLLALLMSMCILPELKSVIRQSDFWINNENTKPLSSLNIYIEIAWIISTGFGLFLFIIELCIIFWIKVSGFSQTAAIAALITLGLVGCPFILFAVGFYFIVARAKVYLYETDLEVIERGAIADGLFMTTPTNPRTIDIEENP